MTNCFNARSSDRRPKKIIRLRHSDFRDLNVHERLSTEGLTLRCQNASLVVAEENPLPAHLIHESPDLSILELDDLLLLTVDQAERIKKKSCQGRRTKFMEIVIPRTG